jgi:hypothetical protein
MERLKKSDDQKNRISEKWIRLSARSKQEDKARGKVKDLETE